MRTIGAGVLDVGYLDDGAPGGWPVVLSHGFPYDVHAYDAVVPLLTSEGARVIRPYQRGFGPTRFRSARTMRSGQQAALGSDLVALAGALDLGTPIAAGYDWGGLASCVTAAGPGTRSSPGVPQIRRGCLPPGTSTGSSRPGTTCPRKRRVRLPTRC